MEVVVRRGSLKAEMRADQKGRGREPDVSGLEAGRGVVGPL